MQNWVRALYESGETTLFRVISLYLCMQYTYEFVFLPTFPELNIPSAPPFSSGGKAKLFKRKANFIRMKIF